MSLINTIYLCICRETIATGGAAGRSLNYYIIMKAKERNRDLVRIDGNGKTERNIAERFNY